jgi:hypothetical protein
MAVQKKVPGARRSTRRAGATAKASRSRIDDKVTGSAPAAGRPAKAPRAARQAHAKAPNHTPDAPSPASLFADAPTAERSMEALRMMEAAIARATPAPVPMANPVIGPATRLMEAGAERTREVYAHAQAANESLRQAMTETASTTSHGALEIQEKVLDALRAQSDAAFDLWRSTLAAGSLSEAVRVQTSGVREFYETATSHWQDVAASTARWFGASMRPFQSALMTGAMR